MSDIKSRATELWDPDRLKPYENNAKTHPPEQIRKLANSIKEHGWRSKPIEIKPDGEIINGHGRWLAATELKMEKVPVTIIDDMTEEQIRKYRLDDNKTAESDIDTNLLSDELNWLNDRGVDLTTTFDERDIDFAIVDLGDMNFDAVAEDISEQVSQQSQDTQDSLKDSDEKEHSLAKTLGYAKITGRQQRYITLLQGHAEASSGEKGAEALASFARDFLEIT